MKSTLQAAYEDAQKNALHWGKVRDTLAALVNPGKPAKAPRKAKKQAPAKKPRLKAPPGSLPEAIKKVLGDKKLKAGEILFALKQSEYPYSLNNFATALKSMKLSQEGSGTDTTYWL